MENEKELKMIETSLPFNDEQLDEYLGEMDQYFFIINIKDSKLNPDQLINYIYNSGMKCDLLIDSYDEKLEKIMLSYIKTNKLVNIGILNELICIALEYRFDNNINIKDKEIKEFTINFVNKNNEIMDELLNVLYNLSIFLYRIKLFEEETDSNIPTKSFKLIGNNFISLRKSMYFYDLFMKFTDVKMDIYNYTNFIDMSINGYKVHHYFYDEFSPFSVIDLVTIGDEENEKSD